MSTDNSRKASKPKSVKRYLLYAIGEVTLVVLGILIALQVNNWNEKRKREAEILSYLGNLKEAVQRDIQSLNGTISFNSLRLSGVFYLLRQADLDTSTFTEFEWVNWKINDEAHNLWSGPYPDTLNREFAKLSFSLLGRGFGGASFDKSVMNELYSTGSFSYIRNTDLKRKIGEYYSYLEKRLEGYAIEEHEEWANEVTRYLRDSYGIFTLDVSDMPSSIMIIAGKKDVERHIRYLALEINYHCIWSMRAKTLAEQLIQQIELEEDRYMN